MTNFPGVKKRTKKIETYDPIANSWKQVDFRLFFGVERGIAFSLAKGEIMILGGRIRTGDTKLIYCYNVQKKTTSFKKPMLKERVLQKSIYINNIIYVFGGDQGYTNEKATVDTYDWQIYTPNLSSVLKDINLKPFTQVQSPLIIEKNNEIEQNSIQNNENTDFSKVYALFGNDSEPFIIRIDIIQKKITTLEVPYPLFLCGFQGGTKIGLSGEIFLAGGLTHSRKRISGNAYIYDMKTHKASKLEKMKQIRYIFSVVYSNNYIYVLGGREYGNDDNAILKSCERYNILTKKWESIANLNYLDVQLWLYPMTI